MLALLAMSGLDIQGDILRSSREMLFLHDSALWENRVLGRMGVLKREEKGIYRRT
jgi:hypothetical protein